MHIRLEQVKETLMCCVEAQLENLAEVDTEELGEVIDMIKDIEETIYYETVIKAMHEQHPEGRMRKDGGMWYVDTCGSSEMMHSAHDGRSYMNRKMYLEAKEAKKDKATQLRELEKYMSELSNDITEMIADTSADEKSYLEKKLTALAAKIGQMK